MIRNRLSNILTCFSGSNFDLHQKSSFNILFSQLHTDRLTLKIYINSFYTVNEMVKFSLGGFKQENAMIFEQKHMEVGSVGPTKQKSIYPYQMKDTRT